MAVAQHLPRGRHQAGDRHLKFHEDWDNLIVVFPLSVRPMSVVTSPRRSKTRSPMPLKLVKLNVS